MPEILSAIPLGPEGIDQAYPIVHTQFPALVLENWRRYARTLIGDRSPMCGVMTAQHGGYIRGLFCHWPDHNLLHGDMLVIDNLAIMDLFDPDGAAQTLVEAMESIAERNRCSAIHTLLPEHLHTPLHGHLQAKGHEVKKVLLCKSL